MLRHIFALSIVALVFSSCAQQPPPTTPSGNVEYTFHQVDAECIRNAIINKSLDAGWQPKSNSQYQLILERNTQNIVAAALLSSKALSNVNERITFTFVKSSPHDLRMMITAAYITNPGTAFEQPTSIRGTASDQAAMQANLPSLEQQCRR
jgi:hypothetical protein